MAKLDTQESPLIAEFLKDHQQFSRLLFQIKKLLDEGKIEAAQQRAEELDQLAGPHIEFEETELYPRLKILGARQATEELLVDQHHDALLALQALIEMEEPDEDSLEGIKKGFGDALNHAEHCGSLISLMVQLDQDQQAESLRSLIQLRSKGNRWTQLDS